MVVAAIAQPILPPMPTNAVVAPRPIWFEVQGVSQSGYETPPSNETLWTNNLPTNLTFSPSVNGWPEYMFLDHYILRWGCSPTNLWFAADIGTNTSISFPLAPKPKETVISVPVSVTGFEVSTDMDVWQQEPVAESLVLFSTNAPVGSKFFRLENAMATLSNALKIDQR